jgi:hypothetical protein
MTSATLHWREQIKLSAIARDDGAQQIISRKFIFDARLRARHCGSEIVLRRRDAAATAAANAAARERVPRAALVLEPIV